MDKVSLVPCADYEPARVREALEACLEPIGGLAWVKPGMRVALKCNLLTAMKPEQAATTHPVIAAELTKMLIEKGAQVVLGDSPGGPWLAPYLATVYRMSGMHLAQEAGAELNYDLEQREADFPEAREAKKFAYTAYLAKADAVINLCKLKTHGMMGLSAAVKNFFGAIPGTIKPEYHYRYPERQQFAHMLVDLQEYFKPVLHIADGIMAMEGNGPSAGTPRHMGVLLASASPYAMDCVCADLIGLARNEVPTICAAAERGLGTQFEVIGDWKAYAAPDFQKIRQSKPIEFDAMLGIPVGGFLKRSLRTVPRLAAPKDCVGCAKCASICPAHAIVMKNKLPVIDRKTCIACFCCQEFCPTGAMKTHRPWIARVLNP